MRVRKFGKMFLLMDGLGYGQARGSMETVEMKAK